MSGGLVGRVEQLLEQSESHRIDEHVIREGLKYAAEITAGAPIGINPEPGLCALDRLVAAVNLVEPLARDWQAVRKTLSNERVQRTWAFDQLRSFWRGEPRDMSDPDAAIAELDRIERWLSDSALAGGVRGTR